MKKHTKIYLNYFDFQIPEDCFCELCESRGVDIHHIDARGMGGDPKKDVIENLMCLCRSCHENYGDVPECVDRLREVHVRFMERHGVYKRNAGSPVAEQINK